MIVMDMSETYRRIARRYFPNAMIVADRLHGVRLVDQRLLRLWQRHVPEGRKNRRLLSLMPRRHWKLAAAQKERLRQYLAQSPVLQALCFAKQQLDGFLVKKCLRGRRAKQMRYQAKLKAESEEIADWPPCLTANHGTWVFMRCFLYLRNLRRFGWNHTSASTASTASTRNWS